MLLRRTLLNAFAVALFGAATLGGRWTLDAGSLDRINSDYCSSNFGSGQSHDRGAGHCPAWAVHAMSVAFCALCPAWAVHAMSAAFCALAPRGRCMR